jgi:Raf kinase inhibitor-like YbhB/YbcL family protein
MALIVTSPSFKEGEMIPAKHTCDSYEVSPPLYWEGVPERAESVAVIVEDPDAPGGTWDHWVVFNLPPDFRGLSEDIEGTQGYPDSTKHGLNSWDRIGWGGPCPPSGTHRYQFRVYALDAMLALPNKSSKQDVVDAMRGHVLAEGLLTGRYARQKQG